VNQSSKPAAMPGRTVTTQLAEPADRSGDLGRTPFRPVLSLSQHDITQRRAGHLRQSGFLSNGIKIEWRQRAGTRFLSE